MERWMEERKQSEGKGKETLAILGGKTFILVTVAKKTPLWNHTGETSPLHHPFSIRGAVDGGAVWRGFQKSFGILLGPGSSLSDHPTSTCSPGPGRYKWASPRVGEGQQSMLGESVRRGELSPMGHVHEHPPGSPVLFPPGAACSSLQGEPGGLRGHIGLALWVFTGHLQNDPVKSADVGLASGKCPL